MSGTSRKELTSQYKERIIVGGVKDMHIEKLDNELLY